MSEHPLRPRECVDWRAAAERYRGLVWSISRRYGLSLEDRRDVFQGTWAIALSKPLVPEDGGMVPWLAAITCFQCREVLRRRRMSRLEDDDAAVIEDQDEPLPEQLLADTEEEQAVRTALTKLRPRDRRLLEMLYFSRPPLTYAQAAEALGVAPGSIAMLRQRAIAALRDVF